MLTDRSYDLNIRRAVSKLNENLPHRVAHIGRSAIHAWGLATSAWRMSPDFIVVGAQRAGTTTLFRVLSDHPDVVRPTLSKGIGYFDLSYSKGYRWYQAHFPLRSIAMILKKGRAKTFESSGYYLFHPLAAERIAQDLPAVKIVVMVRNPVERAYSAHRHEYVRGFETENFETALELEEERLRGEEDRIREDPEIERYNHRHHAYVGRGRYAIQIQRYIDLLGPDQVYIVDADRFFVEIRELERLFHWLGLSDWLPTDIQQWNAQKREAMLPSTRAALEEEFRTDDLNLAKLMGRTPSWFREAI